MTSDLAKLMEYIDKLQTEATPEPIMEIEQPKKLHPLLEAMQSLKEEGIIESVVQESLEIDIEEEIAYHGTTDDIVEFHPFTHFGTEKAAKDRMEYKKIKDGKIYKVDLDIKNPLKIKDFPGIHYDRVYAFELRDKGLISQEEMEDITFTQDKNELRQKLLNKLSELGIDGFVYKNKYEDKGNISYVIVDPSQVKVLSVEPANEIAETISTGQGGGSAGNGGAQMVGGPTTYEQEYGMFKSKGPRRITAMTNEDETLTELMTQSYKWYNYEPNSYYFDNAQGDECVVYFEGNGADHVEVSFVVDSFTNITGKGDSFKIISTVVNIIKDYLTKNNPKTLTFAADNAEPSRVKLYSALVTKLAQAVPGYKLNKPTRERFDTYYTISRKNSKSVSEALDSSYPYEEYSAGKYHFITDNGVKYKVYLQGKDMVEVAFSAILPGEEENFRPDKTTLTGTGDSRKVFGTVVKIVKEYLDTHKPNALYFTAENAEPSRIKLYNRLIAQVDKELPDYQALGNIDLGTGTAYMLKRKESEPVTESTETTTLDQIYHGMRPDHDEMIWNYVGDSDFDTEFPVESINPTKLGLYLKSQYRIEDLEELFDMMEEDQEILVNHYMKEPNLSNEIIVMYDGKVVDGNHRALAAALTNKPIRYIDIGEEDESS